MTVNYYAWHIDKAIWNPYGEKVASYGSRHSDWVAGVINRQMIERGEFKKREENTGNKFVFLWHISGCIYEVTLDAGTRRSHRGS